MLDRKLACALAALVALTLRAGPARAASFTIDCSKTYQTIEGFGFFGGADVWWSSASAVLDQAWTAKVIDDLGITMWRNEYYAAGTPQDATWDKQRPVVQGLVNYAAGKGVKLKILLTAWSPPASMKCLSDDGIVCNSDPPTRPADTKNGNILDPAMRADLAAWLCAGAQMYHDAGADLYGLSFQNEPLFKETYNSCVYKPDAYAKTLAAIGPTLKAAFPDLKLFGSENMLGTECGKSPGTAFDPYWYTANLMNVPAALAAIDAFAVHGYVDGVSATATSKLASLWTSFRTGTASTGKAIWMTETSGYSHTWPGTSSDPGPLDLAQAIYAALAYGNLSAWTYWQGSNKGGYDTYSLMAGASSLGKNYFVAKQFYRFIRPGAERVDLQSDDPAIMAVAFRHPAMNSFTLVAINTGASKSVSLSGTGLPADFHAFRTSATEDAVDLGTVAAGDLSLPASSITTFVNGSYQESPGSGGSGGAGGASGAGGGGTAGATATGGRAGSGGATGSGGRTGTGGRGSGGVTASGGKTGGGGATGVGGKTGAGGASATGGRGGATSGGGMVGSGGTATTAPGGSTGTVVATGGSSTGGKAGASGGASGSGGSTGPGGGTGSGGAGGTGGAGGGTTSVTSAGGLGCGIGGRGGTGSLIAVMLAALALLAPRRRAAARRHARRRRGRL